MRSDETERLITACESEAKRWGGDPGYLHLAVVLARRWEDEFQNAFGADGLEPIEQRLRDKQYIGDLDGIRNLLSADERTAVLTRLTDLLAAPSRPTPNAETTAEPDVEQDEDDGAAEQDQILGLAARVEGHDIVGRDAELRELTARLIAETARPVVVSGDAGSGRTSLIEGLPGALAAAGIDTAVYTTKATGVSAEDLHRLLRQAPAGAVIVVDDIDHRALLRDSPPSLEHLRALRLGVQQSKAKVVVTVETRNLARFDAALADFGDRLTLSPLVGDSRAAAVAHAVDQVLDRYPGISASAELRTAVTAPATRSDKYAHPGLAARRIDIALARTRVDQRTEATISDFDHTGSAPALKQQAHELASSLKQRIKGQDTAIDAVTRRLALTHSNLDLRPERPNGVFLFVGPTGVGKTELAREIARVEYGSADALIRLDMSEYSHSWAVSRLTGPMPGYVGSDNPDDWLTTKVADMPQCVVLLDEIEKAHPSVWNTFLQVFDAGRLTDSRGTTADFGDAVIVMTSNLGVRESSSRAVGFGDGGGDDRSRTLAMDALKKAMPPELLNRLDEIAQFQSLTLDAITEIAELEVAAAVEMLAGRGWHVDIGDGVVHRLATTGYDPAYGARHLHRNIERLLLSELVAFAGRGQTRVAVTVDGDELRIGAIGD